MWAAAQQAHLLLSSSLTCNLYAARTVAVAACESAGTASSVAALWSARMAAVTSVVQQGPQSTWQWEEQCVHYFHWRCVPLSCAQDLRPNYGVVRAVCMTLQKEQQCLTISLSSMLWCALSLMAGWKGRASIQSLVLPACIHPCGLHSRTWLLWGCRLWEGHAIHAACIVVDVQVCNPICGDMRGRAGQIYGDQLPLCQQSTHMTQNLLHTLWSNQAIMMSHRLCIGYNPATI